APRGRGDARRRARQAVASMAAWASRSSSSPGRPLTPTAPTRVSPSKTATPEPRRRRARRSGARVRASSAYFHPFPQDTRMGQALPYPVVLPKLRDPRLHLAATITSLQVIGQVGFYFQLSIAQILLSVGTCAALEVAIALRTQ